MRRRSHSCYYHVLCSNQMRSRNSNILQGDKCRIMTGIKLSLHLSHMDTWTKKWALKQRTSRHTLALFSREEVTRFLSCPSHQFALQQWNSLHKHRQWSIFWFHSQYNSRLKVNLIPLMWVLMYTFFSSGSSNSSHVRTSVWLWNRQANVFLPLRQRDEQDSDRGLTSDSNRNHIATNLVLQELWPKLENWRKSHAVNILLKSSQWQEC